MSELQEMIGKIEVYAYMTDDFMSELIQATNSPLIASTIVLSRLMLINDEAGTGAEFRKLMAEVFDKMPKQENVH
jgi:hypothetical protein